MGGMVAGDQMNIQILWNSVIDGCEKFDGFLLPVALMTLPNHFPVAVSSAANGVDVPCRVSS